MTDPAYPAKQQAPGGNQVAPAPQYSQGPPPPANYSQPQPAVYGQQPPPQYGQQPPPQYGQQPPPQYGQQPVYHNQQHQQQQNTVIINQPTNRGIVGGFGLGPSSVSMTCPYCSAAITTTTSKHCGAGVWMWCGIICLIGLFVPFVWLGCCLIPFCIPTLYNTKHACPNCQREVGTYSAGGI